MVWPLQEHSALFKYNNIYNYPMTQQFCSCVQVPRKFSHRSIRQQEREWSLETCLQWQREGARLYPTPGSKRGHTLIQLACDTACLADECTSPKVEWARTEEGTKACSIAHEKSLGKDHHAIWGNKQQEGNAGRGQEATQVPIDETVLKSNAAHGTVERSRYHVLTLNMEMVLHCVEWKKSRKYFTYILRY